MSGPKLFVGSPAEVAAKRVAIAAAAMEWIGTPFHDCAAVKGAGVDCVHLLEAVFKACGFAADFSMPDYPPQWFQHRDEPRFLNGMALYARRIPLEQLEVGDVAMIKYGRHAAHGTIVVAPGVIVHASSTVKCVTRGALAQFLPRLDSCWSVFA